MYEKKLGFKFYNFFVNISLPLSILYISVDTLNIVSQIFNAESSTEILGNVYSIVFEVFQLVCIVLMLGHFNTYRKSAFTVFFVHYTVLYVVTLLCLIESVILSDIELFCDSIVQFAVCIPITIYMHKRRNIFTPGTWEHEEYSNYLESKRKKYSPEKVKPDTKAHGQSTGRGCMPPEFEYDGNYVDGLRHGYGYLSYKGEPIYKGEFRHDLISGKGSLIGRHGIVYYTGEFHGRFDREVLQQWRAAVYNYIYPPITLSPKKGYVICAVSYNDGTFEEKYVDTSTLSREYKKYCTKGILYILGSYPRFGVDGCKYISRNEWGEIHFNRRCQAHLLSHHDDNAKEHFDDSQNCSKTPKEITAYIFYIDGSTKEKQMSAEKLNPKYKEYMSDGVIYLEEFISKNNKHSYKYISKETFTAKTQNFN